ncbi:MAG: DUF2167 domain-containing protein [Gloeobacteraceae cyanobacterium ES-bin-144]|nr:DUF2167 domain-containing protein [Verrucomicrobiales bacterium]
MRSSIRLLVCGVMLSVSAILTCVVQGAAEAPAASAEQEARAQEFKKFIESLDWKTQGSGTLGSIASIQVPAGYRFTGTEGTVKLMEMYGNLTSGKELGYLSPLGMDWFAVFEFDDCGYVKDDEKDKLDANEILKQLQQGQEQANAELFKRGMATLQVLGWQTPPFYNNQTNNLEWAVRLRSSDGGETVNYKTKLLGRRGVMDVVLVCDEQQMSNTVAEYQKLLTGYAFNKEESYAAFSKGDKVAEYGLTGLIIGGGLLAAAKSGLLAKLWKPIAIGLVAVGAFMKRIFVGKTKESI